MISTAFVYTAYSVAISYFSVPSTSSIASAYV